MPDSDLEAIERWFVGRGVPHFIDDYAATTDIWNRAIPLLVAGYLLGGLNALDIKRSLGWNLAAFGVIVVILATAWAITNRARHRRLWSPPSIIGPVELAVFVIGPAIPSVALGQWPDAIQTVLEGLGVLLAVYLVTSYGVIPLTRWAAHRSGAQLRSFGNVVVRVLPLLLLFILTLFINAEVWQVAGTLQGTAYWLTIGIFFLLGSVFVLSRVPGLVASLSNFDSWDDVHELLANTPAATLDCPAQGDPDEAPTSRRERFNIGLVSVFSQAQQVTLMVAMMYGFLVLFGFLAIPAATAAAWTTLPADQIHVLFHFGARPMVITEPLLRVAGFLAAFTGMYFTVVLSTDSTYRDEVAQDVAPEIRQAFAVRAAYRHAMALRNAPTADDR